MIRFDDTFEAFNTVLTFSLCLEDSEGVERAKGAEGSEGVSPTHEDAPPQVSTAFHELHALCERYENLFSRTISTSDVSRINGAQGEAVAVATECACLAATLGDDGSAADVNRYVSLRTRSIRTAAANGVGMICLRICADDASRDGDVLASR